MMSNQEPSVMPQNPTHLGCETEAVSVAPEPEVNEQAEPQSYLVLGYGEDGLPFVDFGTLDTYEAAILLKTAEVQLMVMARDAALFHQAEMEAAVEEAQKYQPHAPAAGEETAA
jgi:hypothetical protein